MVRSGTAANKICWIMYTSFHREPEEERGTQPENQELDQNFWCGQPVKTDLKQPTPHKTLTRRKFALLSQFQTNTLPTVPFTHRFQRLPGTPKCPDCGEYPSNYLRLWSCTQNPKPALIPNPTLPSWERRLADYSGEVQRTLIEHPCGLSRKLRTRGSSWK